MLYEFCIAFSSVIISFVLYFGFSNFFRHNADRGEIEDDEQIQYDERRDLDGKELLLVNVVRSYEKSPNRSNCLHPFHISIVLSLSFFPCHFI